MLKNFIMSQIFISAFALLPCLLLLFHFSFSKHLKKIYSLAHLFLYPAILLGIGGILASLQNEALNITLFNSSLAPSFRIDALSSLLYTMISIIGLIVLRYSRNYLEGEARHSLFISRLVATIALVQLLVISDNLTSFFCFWVGTSIGLHHLLLFYPERRKAQLAAKKKFILARLGDLTLLGAFLLFYLEWNTTDFHSIFENIQSISIGKLPFRLELAVILLVVTACLKSVQFPFHSWLLEVMETPTPVSALLHAGLLNAGPFLILRFAPIIQLSNTASFLLIAIGGFSALFGALASSSQSAIKTSLAYSSVGHMGFTLFMSGLGIFPAALLHLVAHSFYKAHAFLSSGSLIDTLQRQDNTNYIRKHKPFRQLVAIIGAVLVYGVVSYFWLKDSLEAIPLLIVSFVIFLGILNLYINLADSNSNKRTQLRLLLASFLVIQAFYGLEYLFSIYLENGAISTNQIPYHTTVLLLIILTLFTLTVLTQTLSNKWKIEILNKLHTHFRNGWYINQYMNRALASLSFRIHSQNNK